MPPQNTSNNLSQGSGNTNDTSSPVPVFTATPSSGIKTMPSSPEEMHKTVAPLPPPPPQPAVPPAPAIPQPVIEQNPNFIPPGVVVPPIPPTVPISPIPFVAPKPVAPAVRTTTPTSRPVLPTTPQSYREPILESDKIPFQPVTAPAPEPTPAPVQEKNPAIRTLQGDIAETVQGRGLSIADIAIAEQKRRSDSDELRPEPKTPTNWWVVGTVLFSLLTIGIVTLVIYLLPDTEIPIVEEPLSQTQFPADERATLDVTGMTFGGFTQEIKTRLLANLNLGTLQTISLVETTEIEPGAVAAITTEEFFSLIKSRAPSRLVRSLEHSFVFGLATVDRPTAFVMFSTNVFETAFAGTLEWEAFMVDDLPFIAKDIPTPLPAPVVQVPIATTTASTTPVAASSTPSTAPVLPAIPQEEPTIVFKDIVVQNEDVRAAMSPDGTILLLYSFPDKNTLIITQSKETLTLILQRLSTARFTR